MLKVFLEPKLPTYIYQMGYILIHMTGPWPSTVSRHTTLPLSISLAPTLYLFWFWSFSLHPLLHTHTHKYTHTHAHIQTEPMFLGRKCVHTHC